MPNTPNDLIRITEVVKQYRPKRSWWNLQVSQSKILAYKVPGDRALYFSQADVERLTAPYPYVRGEDSSKPKTST